MKADVDRAKQAALLGEDYNPAIPGVGAAWSHNFLNQVQSQDCVFLQAWLFIQHQEGILCGMSKYLNLVVLQKPWHPLNYRNQLKVYEAQQQAEADAKAKAIGKVMPYPCCATPAAAQQKVVLSSFFALELLIMYVRQANSNLSSAG